MAAARNHVQNEWKETQRGKSGDGETQTEDTLSIPGEALGAGHSGPTITPDNQYLIKVSTEPSPARPCWSTEGEKGKERMMREGEAGD